MGNKEYPLLMAADMVKATLDDLKTVTRRLDKLQFVNKDPNSWDLDTEFAKLVNDFGGGQAHFITNKAVSGKGQPSSVLIKFPYEKGNILYVRETTWVYEGSCKPHYLADELPNNLSRHFGKIIPSIHMFRKDARLFLKVLEATVERLQDISYGHCYDELGISVLSPIGFIEIKNRFQAFWDKLYAGKGYGWSFNPWVRVVRYKRLENYAGHIDK